MNTNVENIYKKMKPDELALISFKAISTQDADLMDTVEANVKHKTYVGRDIDYSQNLNNRVNFSVWFGLQYHNVSSLLYGLLWQIEKETNEAGLRELEAHKCDYYLKQSILLNVANSLCNEYRIDKKTFLGLAQITLPLTELENARAIEYKYLDDDMKKYFNDMTTLFKAVLNQNYGDSKNEN